MRDWRIPTQKRATDFETVTDQPYTCTDPSYTCFYQNFQADWGCGNQVTGNLFYNCLNAGFAQTAVEGTLLW
jgi:hypothetical protein